MAAVNGEILSLRGYKVDVTNNAIEAIARMRKRRYDLVVSTEQPVMDGRGLFEAITAEFPDLRSRTAFLTGDRMGSSSQQFLKESGRPFLEKPVSARELGDFVGGLLAAAERQA